MTFHDAPLLSGESISQQAGSTDIIISEAGVYQAAFHSTVTVGACITIPTTVTVRLEADGVSVPGAIARHTFTFSNETATLAFTVPFTVTAPPVTLRVVVDEAGFIFSNVSLIVMRLGNVAP